MLYLLREQFKNNFELNSELSKNIAITTTVEPTTTPGGCVRIGSTLTVIAGVTRCAEFPLRHARSDVRQSCATPSIRDLVARHEVDASRYFRIETN